MLWDGLIIILILGLAVSGWNIGIVNSWRGPFAILVATLVTAQCYVDFATYVVQQLRFSPEQAIVTAYVLMWCGIEIIVELLMTVGLRFNKKSAPTFFERAFGAGFGVIKGLIIALLPMMALLGPITVPKPPPDKAPLINPIESGADAATIPKIFSAVGKTLMPTVGDLIISRKQPSFTPTFPGGQDVSK